MHITTTLIGRKTFYLIVILTLFTSCDIFNFGDDGYDYNYYFQIKNSSNDTLTVVLGDTSFYNYSPIPTIVVGTILPDSTNNFESIYTVCTVEGEDPVIDVLFEQVDPYFKEAHIFRHDSLIVSWEGPASDMGDTHHFFNYNSWDYWLNDEWYGNIQFTIYNSDVD